MKNLSSHQFLFQNPDETRSKNRRCATATDIVRCDFLTPEQIDETLQQWYQTAKDLKERYNAATNKTIKKAILHEYKQSPIFPYLDTPDLESEFRINLFSVLNKYYVERVKSCYCDSQKLIQAYTDADYFNLSHTDAFDYTLTLDNLDIPWNKINTNTPQKEQIQAVIDQLRIGVKPEQILISLKSRQSADHYVSTQNLIEAVQILGVDAVSTKTTFKAIEKLLEPAKRFQLSEDVRFSAEVILQIKNEFEADMNTPILKEQIKQRLEKIYSQYDFIKKNGRPFAVTLSTIEDYFDTKSNNEKRTYRLLSLWPNLNDKIVMLSEG